MQQGIQPEQDPDSNLPLLATVMRLSCLVSSIRLALTDFLKHPELILKWPYPILGWRKRRLSLVIVRGYLIQK